MNGWTPSFIATGQQLISVWVTILFLNIEISQAESQDNGIHNVHQEKEKIEQLQKRRIGRDIPLLQIKIKQKNYSRKWTAIYAIVSFFGGSGAIACDDHFF